MKHELPGTDGGQRELPPFFLTLGRETSKVVSNNEPPSIQGLHLTLSIVSWTSWAAFFRL